MTVGKNLKKRPMIMTDNRNKSGIKALNKKFLFVVLLLLVIPSFSYSAIIEGRVFSADGPINGMVIDVYNDYGDLKTAKPFISSPPTDELGYYSFHVPEGEYYFTAKGRNDGKDFFAYHGKNPVKIEKNNIWLVLMANAVKPPDYSNGRTSVKGIVTFKGKPVGGANISFYNAENKSLRGLGDKTEQSSWDGTFDILLPPDKYVIIARKNAFSYYTGNKGFEGGSSGKQQASGKDVPGTTVPSVKDPSNAGKTENDKFGPLKNGGLYCYYALSPLEVRQNMTASIVIPCYPKGDRDPFSNVPAIKDSDYVTMKNLIKAEKFGITGRITNLEGSPLEGIHVFAYRGDPSVPLLKDFQQINDIEYTVKTQSDGSYFIPLNSDGYYHILARSSFGGKPKPTEVFGLYKQGIPYKKGQLIDNIDLSLKSGDNIPVSSCKKTYEKRGAKEENPDCSK